MIKMIKKGIINISYWESWFDSELDEIILHYGKVGHLGTTTVFKKQANQDLERIINEFGENMNKRGFKVLDPDTDLTEIIIQYRIVDGINVELDLDKRYNVENILNECLGWTGNGFCDGGDYGSGTMNVFCYVIDVRKAASL